MPCFEDGLYQRLREQSESWLRELDDEPDRLRAHIAAAPVTIDWDFTTKPYSILVTSYPKWSLLAHELPVYEGKGRWAPTTSWSNAERSRTY